MNDPDEHLESIRQAEKLLPAWFIPRMMEDVWFFGLLLSDGTLACIETILEVRQAADGAVWLEVRLASEAGFGAERLQHRRLTAPTSRNEASINAGHVMAAFELADT